MQFFKKKIGLWIPLRFHLSDSQIRFTDGIIVGPNITKSISIYALLEKTLILKFQVWIGVGLNISSSYSLGKCNFTRCYMVLRFKTLQTQETFLHNVWTVSGTHTAACLLSTVAPFPWGIDAGTWDWPLTSSHMRLWHVQGAALPLPIFWKGKWLVKHCRGRYVMGWGRSGSIVRYRSKMNTLMS